LVNVIYLPIYSRYGILSFMISIVYIGSFFLIQLSIYVMITVCTQYEIKFELEIQNKELNCNCLETSDWR